MEQQKNQIKPEQFSNQNEQENNLKNEQKKQNPRNTKQQSEKSKKLWGNLKKLLLKDKKFKVQDKIQFELLQKIQKPEDNIIQYNYTFDNQYQEYKQATISIQINQMKQELSLDQVKKYNQEKVDSTGISLWPSEEVLGYYCIQNIENFKNKSILELGAGFSGLAGLLLAKYLIEIENQNNLNLEITDGQKDCSILLEQNIQQNLYNIDNNLINVIGSQLIWSENYQSNKKFDRIIIADCLFFKNFHQALVNTLKQLIKPEGQILIIGPKRGGTMDLFLEKAQEWFNIQYIEFNDQKYKQQQKLQEKLENYDQDKNFIYFLQLTLK